MKKNFINLVAIFASLFFFYFIFIHRAEVVSVYNATKRTDLEWLAAAVLMQLAAYFFVAKAHQDSLAAAGIKRTKRQILPLILAALVINTAAPTGGASGALLFAEDAQKKGESALAATSGLILLIICSYVGILFILSFAFLYLSAAGHLGPIEVVCFLILLAATTIFSFLLVIAKNDSATVKKVLIYLNSLSYKIRHFFSKKTKKSEDWVDNVTAELSSASKSIYRQPTKLISIVIYFFFVNFFNLTTLFFLFTAFGQIAKTGILVAGYAIGELFKIVSPAPEGVGITEVSMAVVYTSFGMDPVTATAVSLIYRGLNYWIPLGIGFIILQGRHLKPKDFARGPVFDPESKLNGAGDGIRK